MKCRSLILWDHNTERIAEISANLRKVMQVNRIEGTIRVMSEPPLLARMGVLHRVPILEIDGVQWTLVPNCTISEEDCQNLLHMLKDLH